MKKIIILILLLHFGMQNKATHIVGGELSYVCLDSAAKFYLVTMTLYRDCNIGNAAFDAFVYLGYYDKDSLLQYNLPNGFSLDSVEVINIPNTTSDSCLFAPANICVQRAIYSELVNVGSLVPSFGKHYFVFQRCCRNKTLDNVTNPLAQGSSWTIEIPDVLIYGCNSSAVFTRYPPTIICAGKNINFGHSAVDPDGDSLSYHLCPAMDGTFSDGPAPPPPDTLPNFKPILYWPPYNWEWPLPTDTSLASDSLKIDPVSGLLTGTPSDTGQYLVAICVKEWRNGNLLSESRRDFQFNIVKCDSTLNANFLAHNDCTNDHRVNFTNYTYSGPPVLPPADTAMPPVINVSYFWDFGDPTTTNDTSTLENPSWTYSTTGTFNVTLYSNSGLPCANSVTLPVQSALALNPVPVKITQIANTLTAQHPGPIYQWFLNGNSIAGANMQNYLISTGGLYFVLVLDTNNCLLVSDTLRVLLDGISDLFTHRVLVFPNPSTGVFIIKTPFKGAEIRVFDITGVIQHFRIVKRSVSRHNLSHLPKGVYILEIKHESIRIIKKISLE